MTETMTWSRMDYEYDASTIYLLRPYNHSDISFHDPFGHNEPLYFDDLGKAKDFVLQHRNPKVVWVEGMNGWFAPADQVHGWEIVGLALISEVRKLKKVTA